MTDAEKMREMAARVADASACGACRALRTFGDAIRALPLPAAPPDKTAEALEIARTALAAAYPSLTRIVDGKLCREGQLVWDALAALDAAFTPMREQTDSAGQPQ